MCVARVCSVLYAPQWAELVNARHRWRCCRMDPPWEVVMFPLSALMLLLALWVFVSPSLRNTLQHTAEHSTLMLLLALWVFVSTSHCHTLQQPQHTATHRNTLQHTPWNALMLPFDLWVVASTVHNILQHTATHCNTLQHTIKFVSVCVCVLQATIHCNTHCNTHWNTHCNTRYNTRCNIQCNTQCIYIPTCIK